MDVFVEVEDLDDFSNIVEDVFRGGEETGPVGVWGKGEAVSVRWDVASASCYLYSEILMENLTRNWRNSQSVNAFLI